MRTAFIVTFALACLAFAGCVGSGGPGLTAMSAVDALDREAIAWSSDSILLAIFGMEATSLNATPMISGDGPLGDLQNATDDKPGDGRLPMWGAGYYSAEKAKILVLVADTSGARQVSEEEFPSGVQIPAGVFVAFQEMRDTWTVDSPAAIQAIRAENATLDAALAGSEPAQVMYTFSPMDGAWHIEGFAANLTFEAEVDFATGDVRTLEVAVSATPPTGGVTIRPTVPKAPAPPPVEATGMTAASLDPLNFIGLPPCSAPSAQCVDVPFTLADEYDAEATLSWGIAANDFDLYVLDAKGSVVLMAAELSMPESGQATLPAGDYTARIVPWSAAADNWQLEIVFS